MQYATLLMAVAASASAAVLPREPTSNWQVTNFYASSSHDEPFTWSMDITDGYFQGVCQTSTNTYGGQCPGAATPVAFNQTTCGDGSTWGWQVSETESPTYPQQPGFSLRISFTSPGGTSDPTYSCVFIPNNVTCSSDPNNPNDETAILNVPHAFNMTTHQTSSECVYA